MHNLTLPADYPHFLAQLKTRIRAAQIRAALAVNTELVTLYWHLGSEVLPPQQQQGWGAKIIDQLAADVRHELPEGTGLSARNLKYMRAFVQAWPNFEFVQQAAA
jgi:predicted nuclease of restriction endonuclease-like (RecB) superfamily